MLFGFLNVNKPKGITSHDVVARLRKVCKIKQIGHTGTLDPMAEGVLPVAIGKASRLIEFLQERKSYIAAMQFGKISDTYDTDGEVSFFSDIKVTENQVQEVIKNFLGEIEQIPPAYSAVHYNGKRLYELARQGIIPDDIPRRKVFIEKINLVFFDYEKQEAKIVVTCSKGTYIRSIVNDMGQALGCGAVMSGLVRTESGPFFIEKSIPLDDLSDYNAVLNNLINPIDVLSYSCYQLSNCEYQKVMHGQSLEVDEIFGSDFVSLVYQGRLCAISKQDVSHQSGVDGNVLVVKKVFES